ncbi:phosphoribosylaminoimidazolesuccinocarboxamide synthase [Holdemania massiliensis]|uniref:phosphoribosylaminoimidazolesuccinocarboxamide synthase n=1 Tax=Holdemania massiliensis TaxID=1468449 RepID=UPI001F065140|nr:phosphoribosylaminoimidazolesuccinocarboxamide synthase [Holdemania massiliensis]MCH1940839.1 phosphoribosylaminoimidazolesuccinocarboxamide synthase [Holdemania massiliensis]
MEKQEMMYEGKAKQVYASEDPNLVIIHYKDDATAFNGLKKASISNKGVLNNKITTILFQQLNQRGIRTHWVETLNDRDQLCRKVSIVPLEVIVRNVVAGSMAKKFGIEEGTVLKEPVFEICYKNDELGDPMINDTHAVGLGFATRDELDQIYAITSQVNEALKEIFDQINIRLIDFKLEFGKDSEGQILLADEISPDTCRFWEKGTDKKLDKDRFRRELGDVIGAYQEIYGRLSQWVNAK